MIRWLPRLILGRPRAVAEIDDLVVDVAAHRLAGLRHRDRIERIRERLGPPRNWLGRRRGELDYSHLGLRLWAPADRGLVSIALWAATDTDSGYTGRWLPGGQTPPREPEVVATLGLPTHREVDEEEVMLAWHGQRRFVGVDFDRQSGRLTWLHVDYEHSSLEAGR